ncbi:hypothetical protein BH11BAC7_BH11BAC7_30960 [soil metagenome]
MQKLLVLTSFLFVAGLFSCSPEPVSVQTSPSADTSKIYSVPTDTTQKINSVEELLPQLPLLKFPLLLSVDEFKDKKIIPFHLGKSAAWFNDVDRFPEEYKIAGIGKFYMNLKTIALVCLVISPGEAERPDDQQLILTIFNTETNEMHSRIVATANAEDYGSTFMKIPEKGKSFMQFESEDITVTFREFGITGGKFFPDKAEIKTFKGNQKGSDAADLAIKNWMK